MNKCYCLSTNVETRRADWPFMECGIENVVLKNVEITTCKSCGEKFVSINAIHYLHHCVARALWRKRTLTPPEKKFLSKIECPLERKFWEYRRHGRLIECYELPSVEEQ